MTPSSPLILPDLPYDYDALEPIISKEIMELHHKKHHAAYVSNYNKAVEKSQEANANKDLAAEIALLKLLKFNGGGHINHSLFWENLAPKNLGGGELSHAGKLLEQIIITFGSFEKFQELFTSEALALQGSGWVWLGYNSVTKGIQIASCDNQDPLVTQSLIPLLGVDVWEHAYYLQYKNARVDYIKAIWLIINWKEVNRRFCAIER